MPAHASTSFAPSTLLTQSPALGFVLNTPPVPAVIPMQPAALAEFVRILRMSQKVATNPDWWLKVAFREWGGRCAYCGQPLSLEDEADGARGEHATVDHLIPPSVGGPHLHDAVVLACFSCNSAKANQDWLTWGNAADRKTRKRLREMRDRIGQTETFNHLAPDPAKVWTKLQIERVLVSRWAQPRFAVQASLTTGGCFLGVRDRTRVPAEFPAIALGHHGQRVNAPDAASGERKLVYFFERPRDCLAAIWALIEVNAWVKRSDLRPAADLLPAGSDPVHAPWVFVSPNLGDLVRRAYAKPTGFKRHSPEWRAGKVSMGANGGWVVNG